MTVSRFTNLGVPTGVSKFSSSLLPPGNPFVVERDANRFGAFIPPVLTIPTPSPSSLVKSTSSSSLALEYAEDNASSESDDSSFADFSSSSSSESSSVLPVLLLFSRLRRRRRRFRCSFLFLNVFWCWVVVSTFFFSSVRPSSNPWWSSSWSSWSSCFAVQYHSTAVRESKPIATSATAALVARLVVVRLGSIPPLARVSLSVVLTLSLSSNARSRFQFESPIETRFVFFNGLRKARRKRERERERARAQRTKKREGRRGRERKVSLAESLSLKATRESVLCRRVMSSSCVLFYTCVA